MNATEVERTMVRVFAESPIWDSGKPWFSHSESTLQALLLAEYSVLDDRFAAGIAKIKDLHPGAVLVYVNP